MNRIALYLRVSTRDQSLESQRQFLLDFCKRRGWAKPAIYEEKKSGTDATRPELNRLMNDCRHGKIDTVVCYKLDRFGGDERNMVLLLAELETRKIGFISATELIDTTAANPFGKMVSKILAAVAEKRIEDIRERTRDGLAAARKRGAKLGRPRENDTAIARAFALRKKFPKLNASEIARRVKLSKSTLSLYFSGKKKFNPAAK